VVARKANTRFYLIEDSMSPQFIRISYTFSIKVIVRFEYGEIATTKGAYIIAKEEQNNE
jgi:hypothetical protein